MTTTLPRRSDRLIASVGPFLSFFNGPLAALQQDPDGANFAVGNPQEMPMPAYVDALREHLTPQNKDWFAYKLSEPKSQATVARTLTERTGLPWDPADVAMTNGGFAALAVSLNAIVEPGDEVVFVSPPWFFYETLILAAGGEPVRVRLEAPAFDLDVDAIEAAITPRTRAVLINTPHNPSGRIYPLDTLVALAGVLGRASSANGSPVFLICDEPYNRIVYDGRTFHSPSEVYPFTIVTYSYGKTLLAPGMRIGYATVPPTMPGRETFRNAIMLAQVVTGYAFPNALLQHAIEDLERLSIDVGALQRRRDRLVPALREIGYKALMPEGTFYVLARSPIPDDTEFALRLGAHKVLVLPASVSELPGWFRISLTASDGMMERGIEGFRAAFAEAAGS